MQSLERITERLADSKVDFIICGGFAALLHGGSVLTRDALIEAKRAMGRPRDLQAVLELEALRQKRA